MSDFSSYAYLVLVLAAFTTFGVVLFTAWLIVNVLGSKDEPSEPGKSACAKKAA